MSSYLLARPVYAVLCPAYTGTRIYHALIGEVSLAGAIRPAEHDGLDLLPADTRLLWDEVDLLTTICGQTLPAPSARIPIPDRDE